MNAFRNLSWQQVALVAIVVAGTLAAYKFLGDGAAGAVSAIGGVLLAASKNNDRPDPPAPGAGGEAPVTPSKRAPAALFGLFAGVLLVACAAAPDAGVLVHDGFQIGTCQQGGRLAKADGGNAAGWSAYDACMQAHGLRDGGSK